MVQILADEDEAAFPDLALAPFGVEVAVEEHVHPLKDEALGLPPDGDDPLVPVQVNTFASNSGWA